MAVSTKELSRADIQFYKQLNSIQLITGEPIYPLRADNLPTEEELKTKFPNRTNFFNDLSYSIGKNHLDEEGLDKYVRKLVSMNTSYEYGSHFLTYLNSEQETHRLKPPQIVAARKMVNFLIDGGKRGYLVLPTGSGKTVIFVALVNALLSNNPDMRFLISTSSIELLEQTKTRFGEFAPELSVGLIDGDHRQYDKKVTITTYNSLVKRVQSGDLDPNNYNLILDEGHEALTKLRSDTVNKFHNSIIFGFSATPAYSPRKHLEKLLPNQIYKMSIQEAVNQELNCPFSVIYAKTQTDLTYVPLQRGDYKQDELQEAINTPTRNKSVARLYLEMFDGERGFGFCNGIQHATDLAKTFQDFGIAAEYGAGTMKREKRRNLLEALHKGEIKLLFGDKLYTQGVDQPRVSLGLMVVPTTSAVRAEQRLRANRIDPENPFKHSTYVEFLDVDKFRGRTQVTAAEIAGGVSILPQEENEMIKEIRDKKIARISAKAMELDIPGLEVCVETDEALEITKQLIDTRLGEMPKDYLSIKQASALINKGYFIIYYYIKRYPERFREQFGIFKDEKGKVSFGVSRELVDFLDKQLNDISPENFIPATKIMQESGLSYERTFRAIELAKKRRPDLVELIREYKTKAGLILHYPIEFLEIVKQTPTTDLNLVNFRKIMIQAA